MEASVSYYKQLWGKSDLNILQTSWYVFLSRLLIKVSQKRILELGCGVGGFCYYLSNNDNEVIGSNIVGTGINRTKMKHKEKTRVSFLLSDAQKLPFKGNCFDVVILADVLEHIPIPIYALYEVRRVLKPGGFLFITIPNMLSIWLILKWSIGRLNPTAFSIQPIDHKFTYLSVRKLINSCGLRIKVVFGNDFLNPFINTRNARKNRFLKRLYASWEKNFMKYFGRGLIIVAEKHEPT